MIKITTKHTKSVANEDINRIRGDNIAKEEIKSSKVLSPGRWMLLLLLLLASC